MFSDQLILVNESDWTNPVEKIRRQMINKFSGGTFILYMLSSAKSTQESIASIIVTSAQRKGLKNATLVDLITQVDLQIAGDIHLRRLPTTSNGQEAYCEYRRGKKH